MPVLDNARHELFAQQVASGKSYAEAARVSGYSESYATTSTALLSRNTGIQERVTELQAQSARATIMDIAERAEILTRIARTSLTDIYEVTDEGVKLKDGQLSPEHGIAVSGVDITEFTGGKSHRASSKRMSIKMRDGIEAIKVLNTMSGISDDNNKLMTLLEGIRAIGQANQKQLAEPQSTDDSLMVIEQDDKGTDDALNEGQ